MIDAAEIAKRLIRQSRNIGRLLRSQTGTRSWTLTRRMPLSACSSRLDWITGSGSLGPNWA